MGAMRHAIEISELDILTQQKNFDTQKHEEKILNENLKKQEVKEAEWNKWPMITCLSVCIPCIQ
jgi:uncharacterized protein YjaG (DUF416 family)